MRRGRHGGVKGPWWREGTEMACEGDRGVLERVQGAGVTVDY